MCGMSLCKTAIKKLTHNVVHGHSNAIWILEWPRGHILLGIQTQEKYPFLYNQVLLPLNFAFDGQ